ncbi:MAG: flagellar filament capping protein FliD, partial [Acidothermus sp.]|nr:flagellar filament capping protein FliD [Acidothermus sp.]
MTTSSVGSTSGSGVGSFSSSTGSSSRIDGLASGLDTTAIIAAIMQQAARPQTSLKNLLAIEQAKLTAYQQINSQLASLQSAADALTSSSTWQAMTVTSSSATVSATASTGAQPGTFTFDVTQLASGQTSVSANTVSSTAAIVTNGNPVTITVGSNGPVTIDTGDGSLAAVAAGINKANIGVQAAIVQVGSSSYRLQISSTTTGAGASFSVSGLDSGALGGFNNVATAQDAIITVGAGTPGQYSVSSSSNTFNQVLPGLTFTVSQVTTGVTLTVKSDTSGIADKVQAMVDAANAVLSAIDAATAYDPSKQQASVLTGDSTMERIRNSILGAISSVVGANQSAASIGLSVTKDGRITFDSDAFEAAYAADPAGVRTALGPSGSFAPVQTGLTGTITLQSSADASLPGTYDVTITRAATRASGTIDTSAGLAAGQTVTISLGSSSLTYTVQSGDTVQSVVDGINALAAQNAVGISASIDPNNPALIDLTSNSYGSQYTFTSSATGGLVASAVTAGQDVAGTINGQTAQG